MPLQDMLISPLTKAITDHHIEEWLWIPAGQGVGYVTEERTTAEVMLRLMDEARETLAAHDPAAEETSRR